MKKAEEAALKTYPVLFSERNGYESQMPDRRNAFQLGYERAEGDLRPIAMALVDAVERYVEPKPGDAYCSRNEVLLAKNKLKKLLAE